MKLLTIILLVLAFTSAVCAQGDFADPVSQSKLVGVNLPGESFLVREQNVPGEYAKLMNQYVGSDPTIRQGKSELLVITGGKSKKTDTGKLRGQFEDSLRSAGWNYEVHGQEKGVTFFTAIKSVPVRRGVFGYWLTVDGNLMIVMTEVFTGKSSSENSVSQSSVDDKDSSANSSDRNDDADNQVLNRQKTPNVSEGAAQTFNLSASQQNVNVMGSQMPKMPSFPAVPKKTGKIRGYVKDLSGNSLRGAAIGLGSIRIGSSRVITQTVTDSKGYYELDLPLNSGNFHYAAYALDYGEGKAAMTLHPADGDINDNPPGEGGVENFVLLPYGIANRSMLAENSNYSASFYGGAIALFIETALPGAGESINRGKFQLGSQIEITLSPIGSLIDGSAAQSFVIRKKIDENTRNEFFINNIPVGKYRLTIKTANGKPVGMRQRLPENSVYGIHPTEANGEAEILFYPSSGNPTEIGAGSGGWKQVEIYLAAPAG